MGKWSCCILVVLALLASGGVSASAEPRVDWERGLVIASAAAPADLRAPNPTLARVKAERTATRRCREKLRSMAASLPTAVGKNVGKTLKTSLADASLGFIPLGSDQGSDGSVVVDLAVTIDSVRGLIYGADPPLASPTPSAPIFVDARNTRLMPVVGLSVRAGNVEYRGPVLYFQDEEQARLDPRVGKDATLHLVKNMKQGIVEIGGETPAQRFESRPLVVVLYSEKR